MAIRRPKSTRNGNTDQLQRRAVLVAFTEDVSELIAQHGVSYHLFADDNVVHCRF